MMSTGSVMPSPADVPAADDGRTLEIRPRRGWIGVNWSELWRYRELLYFMAWRDIKVRYKQTVLGVAWAVLQPLFQVIIFTLIFGKAAGLAKYLPLELQDKYPVYAYAGLLPWLFFANALSLGGMSLVNQQHLLTKIYFPRLFVPTATVTAGLVDMSISFGVFAVMMAWYHAAVGLQVLWLIPLMGLTYMASLGIAFLLSALTVSYRDFRFLIPFMVQVWMYLSPVVYPDVILSGTRLGGLLSVLNPMSGIINAYRSAIFGLPWQWGNLLSAAVGSFVLFVLGMFYFRKTERRFADIA